MMRNTPSARLLGHLLMWIRWAGTGASIRATARAADLPPATVAQAAWQPSPPPPPPPAPPPPPPPQVARPRTNMEILEAVDRGEISVEEAVKLMSGTNP